MKFELGKYKSDEVSETQEFFLKDVTKEVANSLRRTILSEIPCLAIGNVQFFPSKISFPEEMIKKRIEGLYVKNTPTITEGQTFTLNAECPEGVTIYNVMSSQINGLKDNINQDICIIPLKPGEYIKIKFELEKGNAKRHNKWSVAAAVQFELVSEENMDYLPNRTYRLAIETTRVHAPKKILVESCEIILNYLRTLKITNPEKFNGTLIGKNEPGVISKLIVQIPNNHHTYSELINNVLIRMEDLVKTSASQVPDPLKPDSVIYLTAKYPINTYNKAIEDLDLLYKNLLSQIEKSDFSD